MLVNLRPYQNNVNSQIIDILNKNPTGYNILGVMATGTGKTVTFCTLAHFLCLDPRGPMFPTVIGVHRKELLSQISLTLAGFGVRHNFVAQRDTVSEILSLHQTAFKKQFYDHSSKLTLMSVDTFTAREEGLKNFALQQKLWIMDEAHHILKENKWGKAVSNFKNAYGYGCTALPRRLDGKGLGRNYHGVFDELIVGMSTNLAIREGYLCDFIIRAPETYYRDHLGKIETGKEVTRDQLRNAEMKSKIIGDTVENYIKYANGKQFICFNGTYEGALDTLNNFKAKGVSAILLTSKSTAAERFKGMQDFKSKKIQGLLNIALFDEGLDVPNVECVIHAAFSNSESKVTQINGRVLRPVYKDGFDLSYREGRLEAQRLGPKPHGIIIDQVGNIKYHGAPNKIKRFSLEDNKRPKIDNTIRRCRNFLCDIEYERILSHCPQCGTSAFDPDKIRNSEGRTTPEMVDGDLMLLDSKTLLEMELASDIEKYLENPVHLESRVSFAAGNIAGRAQANKQRERIEYAKSLKYEIELWAGKLRDEGYTDREIHMHFYLTFEKTMFQAVTEKKTEMEKTMKGLKNG